MNHDELIEQGKRHKELEGIVKVERRRARWHLISLVLFALFMAVALLDAAFSEGSSNFPEVVGFVSVIYLVYAVFRIVQGFRYRKTLRGLRSERG